MWILRNMCPFWAGKPLFFGMTEIIYICSAPFIYRRKLKIHGWERMIGKRDFF